MVGLKTSLKIQRKDLKMEADFTSQTYQVHIFYSGNFLRNSTNSSLGLG